MARLALAAHDPGGAAVLAAAAPALRARGHDLAWLPAGPAARLWREAGEAVPEALDTPAAAALLARDRPALLLVGTGFGDYERNLWIAARAMAVPSFAILDSWTNIERRFAAADGSFDQPDAFGVIDEAIRSEIAVAGWCRARLFVVGQPHLAARTERLKRCRGERRGGPETRSGKLIVFFSEPIVEDFGRAARGFDQFEVATLVAGALAGHAAVRLAIKPHPRESGVGWRAWQARTPNASLAAEDTEILLATADGVLGMTTMVLVEAGLAGIPALSLQPERPKPANPMLDSMLPVVTRREDVAVALAEWLANLARPGEPPPARDFLSVGSARLVAAVEEILGYPPARA